MSGLMLAVAVASVTAAPQALAAPSDQTVSVPSRVLPIMPANLDPPCVGGADGALTTDDPLMPWAGNGGYDTKHYDIDLTFTPATTGAGATPAFIDATTTITAATTGVPLCSFGLDLLGLTVTSVTVDGVAATFTRIQDTATDMYKLVVYPAAAVSGDFTVTVAYNGTPQVYNFHGSSTFPTGWLSNKTFSVGGTTYPADGGGVGLGEPTGAFAWYPVNADVGDKASYTTHLTVPNDMQAVAIGALQSMTPVGPAQTRWTWDEPDSVSSYLTIAAIGQYAHFADTHTTPGGTTVPIDIYVDAALDAATAGHAHYIDLLKQLLDWGEANFGPYQPAVAGYIMKSIAVNYALEIYGKPFYTSDWGDSIFIHEFAHQWFGDAVTTANWGDLWLNEGFATYVPWLWNEDHGGVTVNQQAMTTYDNSPSTASLWSVAPAAMTSQSQMFGDWNYTGGGLALAALRQGIGPDLMEQVVKLWYSTYAGGSGTTAEFIALAEQVTGADLTQWAHDWLYTTGKPDAWPAALSYLPPDPTVKQITSFTVNGVAGAIDETNHQIVVKVPVGTDLTALSPVIAIDGASVSPASGAVQDFSGNGTAAVKKYTVTAQDGSTQVYQAVVGIDGPRIQTTLRNSNGTSSTTTLAPGGTSSVNLILDNLGFATATDVVAAVPLPAGIDPASVTSTCGYDPATGEMTFSSIAAATLEQDPVLGLRLSAGSAICRITFSVPATDATGATYRFTGSLVSAGGQPLPPTTTETIAFVVVVPGEAWLNPAFTGAYDTAVGNQGFTYYLNLGHTGTGALTGIQVTHQIPSQLTLVSATANVGTYDAATGVWTIDNLPSGVNPVLTVKVDVNGPAGSVPMTAQVTQIGGAAPPSDMTFATTLKIYPAWQLTLSSGTGELTAAPGDTVTHTITFTSASAALSYAYVAVTLPDNATFVSSDAGVNFGCSEAAPTQCSWTVQLAGAGSSTLTLTYTINADAIDGASVTTSATVSGAYPGNGGSLPNPSSTSVTTTVAGGQAPPAQVLVFDASSVTKTYGDASFTNHLTQTGAGALTFSSSDTSVATVNAATGQVSIVGAGNSTISAAAAAVPGQWLAASSSYALTVQQASLSPAVVAVAAAAYTGSPLTPTVTVTLAGQVLAAGTDYTVVYANNTNAGNGTVTVTGAINYTGTVIKQFLIAPRTVQLTVDPIATQTDTGSAITPPIMVRDGATALASGTDYTVAWSNNSAPGTATVTVAGAGNYEGSTGSSTFTIMVQPSVQALTDAVNALPKPVQTWADADKVAQAAILEAGLTTAQRAQVPPSVADALAVAEAQAGHVNLADTTGKGTVTGGAPLGWSVRLVVIPITSSDARWATVAGLVPTGKKLLALYDIKLIDTLTLQAVQPPSGGSETVALSSVPLNGATGVIVIHLDASSAATTLPATVAGNTVSFSTASFSLFGVAGTPAAPPLRGGPTVTTGGHVATASDGWLGMAALLAAVIVGVAWRGNRTWLVGEPAT